MLLWAIIDERDGGYWGEGLNGPTLFYTKHAAQRQIDKIWCDGYKPIKSRIKEGKEMSDKPEYVQPTRKHYWILYDTETKLYYHMSVNNTLIIPLFKTKEEAWEESDLNTGHTDHYKPVKISSGSPFPF